MGRGPWPDALYPLVLIVRFVSQADEEVQEVLAWYRDRSTEAAEALDEQIVHAVEQIRALPLSWPPYRHGTRHYILSAFPYHVIYRVGEQEIVVLALAHVSRRPGYWRKRV